MPDNAATYVEAVATVRAPDADAAAGILRTLADSGTWSEQSYTQPSLESDAITQPDAPVRVHAYFRGNDAAANAALARSALHAAGIDAALEVRAVAEEDWAESWKEHFHVERYGRRLVVVPSWRTYDAAPDDLVIALDPGMAFGTGQHETTRMCLEALEDAVTPGARVLDLGCGSGILGIAAAKLGAARVLALDIDDVCVRVTAANARANRVEAIVEADQGTLDGLARGEFDVVVANIIAGVLIDLAPQIACALAPTGRLIASGVIEERLTHVTRALEAASLRIEHVRAMGDWRCIEALHASTDMAG